MLRGSRQLMQSPWPQEDISYVFRALRTSDMYKIRFVVRLLEHTTHDLIHHPHINSRLLSLSTHSLSALKFEINHNEDLRRSSDLGPRRYRLRRSNYREACHRHHHLLHWGQLQWYLSLAHFRLRYPTRVQVRRSTCKRQGQDTVCPVESGERRIPLPIARQFWMRSCNLERHMVFLCRHSGS
ncbi:hypothetical protein K491DRAFT_249150 [Lophiostoma macrostomum CBS 122681]|uniref:Uncharacterized protein n=1 Tax=Lophiostoma macrostomum CBS 122681 TaxID=1314788 RepID=A0A6A6SN38_9PLEO|nr:hypothetical protein K491DRAFT_249150 [Lophiostoma macrostomum CBS 122681]